MTQKAWIDGTPFGTSSLPAKRSGKNTDTRTYREAKRILLSSPDLKKMAEDGKHDEAWKAAHQRAEQKLQRQK